MSVPHAADTHLNPPSPPLPHCSVPRGLQLAGQEAQQAMAIQLQLLQVGEGADGEGTTSGDGNQQAGRGRGMRGGGADEEGAMK